MDPIYTTVSHLAQWLLSTICKSTVAVANMCSQAPARNAIQYELQRFNITDVTVFPLKYLGKPSEAIEEAWEDLLKRESLPTPALPSLLPPFLNYKDDSNLAQFSQ